MLIKRLFAVAITLLSLIPTTISATNSYGAPDNIQDGVILHCFNWSYNQISGEMENIAKAGFTAVQLSPIQSTMSSGAWYWAYQPLAFAINGSKSTYDNGSQFPLGTFAELKSMINKAHSYGVKVIVDVVANHLHGNEPWNWQEVETDLRDYNCWHHYNYSADGNRFQITHGKMGDYADLDSENAVVQNAVKRYISELKAIGVDGIRWDAAKHIALPSESCDFWQVVVDNSMYNYGEILYSTGGDDSKLFHEYFQYMSITDNQYGNNIREAFANGYVPSGYGCLTTSINADARKLVYWSESHDTYANENHESTYIPVNVIDKTWAIVGNRKDATALYFSRPSKTESNYINLGEKGSTHFTATEVAAVNKVHNACVGQADYVTEGSNCKAVLRQTGATIATTGNGGAISITNGNSTLEAGTYTDLISGNKFTVTSTKITGTVGSTGIAAFYKESKSATYTIYFNNSANWTKVYAYVWSPETLGEWPGKQLTAKTADGYYYITVSATTATNVIFNNGSSAQTNDLTLKNNEIYNASGDTGKTYSAPASGGSSSTGIVTEGFEAMTGTAYLDNKTMQGDKFLWLFNNAASFSGSTNDRFNGKRAVRMGTNATSSIAMAEDKTDGVGTLTFYAAKYGTDANATFTVSYSTNSGTSWTALGSITLSATTLTKYTYNINKSGKIRVKFQQTAGKRFNLDDITLTSYGAASSTTPSTPTTNSKSEGFEKIATTSSYWNGTSKTGDLYAWTFTNAGIFASTSDRYNGTRCVRMGTTETSAVQLTNAKSNGVGTVTFYAARYGSDANATMTLQYSTDGKNWETATTFSITTTTLKQYSATINKSGNIYIRFQQSVGKRFDIDDIVITDYAGSSETATGSQDLKEDFESMSTSSAYKTGVTLTGTACKWTLDNAGTFATSSDRFNGKRSIRMGTNSNSAIYMASNKADGIGTVTFYAAKYGTDGNSTVEVYYSTDGGKTWTLSSTHTISATKLTKFTSTINKSGNVRIKFQQTTGKRFNIDDITLGKK